MSQEVMSVVDLCRQIEEVRQTLIGVAERSGCFTHPDVVQVSQVLDHLMNELRQSK